MKAILVISALLIALSVARVAFSFASYIDAQSYAIMVEAGH